MTSVNAVINNKGVMLLWALMIVALVAIGFSSSTSTPICATAV